MNRQGRHHPPGQPGDAQVLHDDCIGAGFGDPLDVTRGAAQFTGENERVQRDAGTHVVVVEEVDGRGQAGQRNVRRAAPGVEIVRAEIHRVGPVGHGGAESGLVAGGGKQLGRRCVGCGSGHGRGH